MRMTISREIEKGDFCKIAELYDSFYLSMLMKALIDEAFYSGNANFQVKIDFPKEGEKK